MRKRLVSVLLSSALAITAVPQFVLASGAAAGGSSGGGSLSGISGGTYDGIKAMQTAEEVLDELKTDSDSAAAELSLRKEQEDKMAEAVKEFYDSYDASDKTTAAWNEYVSVIYDSATQARVKKYMQMRYISKYDGTFGAKGSELADKLDDLDALYDTTDQTLSDSSDMYSEYQTKVSELYRQYSGEDTLFVDGELKDYGIAETYDSYVKARLFESTKLLLGMVFSSQGLEVDAADTYTGKSFRYSFEKAFKLEDIQKKNLAVFFGSVLTEMTAKDKVTAKVKNYIKTDDAAVLTIKNSLSEIFVEDKAAAVNAAYKLMGQLLSDAYADDTAKQGEIVRLFGDGADKKGAVQLAMKAADSYGTVQNLWLNLLIRRFVQMKAGSVDLTTLSASALESSGTIENGSSGSFEVRGLDDFGLSNANLPLNTGYFKVESTDPTVTYSNSEGKFTVAYDVAKTAPYEAVITIYRGQNALSDVDSFVESYKVSVTPARRPGSNRGSSSSSSSIPISIVQPKAGGSIEGATSVKSGASHKYVIKPQPGYAVSKVYVDGAEYTDYTMDGNNAVVTLDNITEAHSITAEFVKLLTEDTHISYIIGYPDGSFKPNGNISREETATIFFRLLTKEAREKYLSSETSFDDVEADRWSVKAIATLAKMNVLKGYEDGSFRPSETITRAEFATIAYRFYNMSYSGADLFEDISEHWAKDYINAIADAKWIEGYENGEYMPERKITRAEAVTIVNRMLSRAVTAANIVDGAVDFTDCKTADWYYNAVMEASNSHDYEETRLEDGTEKWTEITENPDWSSYEK